MMEVPLTVNGTITSMADECVVDTTGVDPEPWNGECEPMREANSTCEGGLAETLFSVAPEFSSLEWSGDPTISAEQCVDLCEANMRGVGDYCCLGRFDPKSDKLVDCHVFGNGFVVEGKTWGAFHPFTHQTETALTYVDNRASTCSATRPTKFPLPPSHLQTTTTTTTTTTTITTTTTTIAYAPLLCLAGDMDVAHFCDADASGALELKEDQWAQMSDAECMAKCSTVGDRPAGEEYCCEHQKIKFMGDRSYKCLLYPAGVGKTEGTRPFWDSASAGMCAAGVV